MRGRANARVALGVLRPIAEVIEIKGIIKANPSFVQFRSTD